MRIVGLTDNGLRVARNIQNPQTVEYKILAELYPRSTTVDRLADKLGLPVMEVSRVIRTKLRGLVVEE